jgi:hypothetical protein
MFDTIKKLFTDERAELFAERDRLEANFRAQDTAFENEIEQLETKPIVSLRDRETAEKQLAALKYRRDIAAANFRIARDQIHARLRASVPAIDEKIHQLLKEVELTQRQLSVSGSLERTNNIAPARGYLDSNAAKIATRVNAIRTAISELEALKLDRSADISAEIKRLTAAIPPLDVQTERVECGAAIAAGLQYPRTGATA